MEATEVFKKLQPPILIVDDGMSSDARKYVDKVNDIERRRAWDQLSDLAAACQDLKGIDPNYPVLALRLANAYLQASDLDSTMYQLTKALEILDCRIGAQCQQNKAVALLYQGITLHLMNWRNDALHRYEEAHNQFRNAALDWQRSSPGHPRAIQCDIAANQLQDCAEKVLESIAPSKAGLPTPSAWKPKNRPKAAPAPATPFIAPPPLIPLTTFAALIAIVCLLDFAAGLIAYHLGGRIALIITVTVLVAMTAVAALIFARRVFFLNVPQDYAAVVDQSGVPFVAQSGQRGVLFPWSYRVRSLVPIAKQVYKPPKLKVSLGKGQKSGSNIYVSLAIQIDYKVFNPIEAISPSAGLSATKPGSFLKTEEVIANWQKRLQDDLAPLLTDNMWGATETDCYTHREQLQADLRNDLTERTRSWGIEVEELTILDVSSI